MDDQVGDILAERAELEGSAAGAVVVSLLFHGILSALAVWSAWHVASRQASSVMMIRFAKPAPVAEMTPAAPPVTAAPAAPAPKAIEKPKPKPKEKTVPFSPFGKSTKKGREQPAPRAAVAPPLAAPAPAAPAQDIPVGGSGVTSLEGGSFPYSIYIENMKRLIGTHWFRPQAGDDTTTTVYFTIDRDGTIRDANTEIHSVNSLFDRAALRAVLEASPLPPLPFGYSGSYLGVHLKFR